MNTDLVRYRSEDPPQRRAADRPALAPSYHELAPQVRAAILGGRRHLEQLQRPDGSWAGRQIGDTSLTVQLALLLLYLGREESELAEQAMNAVLADQREDGGWSRTSDGAPDVSVSVQAYLALKAKGRDGSRPFMSQARQAIRELGGADAADMTTRLWLALFGQISFDVCRQSPLQGIERASLAVIWSRRPRRELEVTRGVRELFVARANEWAVPRRRSAIRLGQRVQLAEGVGRDAAMQNDTHNVRFDELAWQMIALDAMGLREDSAEMRACESRLQRLLIADEDQNEVRPQPALTPIRDTTLAVGALKDTGAGSWRSSVVGVRSLADECRQAPRASRTRWRWRSTRHRSRRHLSAARPPVELAGLLSAFSDAEDAREDPTNCVLPPDLRLAQSLPRQMSNRVCSTSRRRLNRLANEACECLLRSQNADGGWMMARGSRSLQRHVLRLWSERRPWRSSQNGDRLLKFDSSPDVTGAILEAFDVYGLIGAQAAVSRAVDFLRATQRADGSWDSALGMRFVHGTSWAIRGLIAAGVLPDDEAVVGGAQWLLVHQQECGGWGEGTDSAQGGREFVSAPTTALQTSLALLGLVAAGRADDAAVHRGIQFLVDSQADDGKWIDAPLLLRDHDVDRPYHNELHSIAMPLTALARWAVAADGVEGSDAPQLKLLCDDPPA